MKSTPVANVGGRPAPAGGVSRVKVLRFEGEGESRRLAEAWDTPPVTHTRVEIVREGSVKHLERGVEPGIYIQALRSNIGAPAPGPPTVVAEIVLPRDGDGVIMLDADNKKLDSYYWPLRRREEGAGDDDAAATKKADESATATAAATQG